MTIDLERAFEQLRTPGQHRRPAAGPARTPARRPAPARLDRGRPDRPGRPVLGSPPPVWWCSSAPARPSSPATRRHRRRPSARAGPERHRPRRGARTGPGCPGHVPARLPQRPRRWSGLDLSHRRRGAAGVADADGRRLGAVLRAARPTRAASTSTTSAGPTPAATAGPTAPTPTAIAGRTRDLHHGPGDPGPRVGGPVRAGPGRRLHGRGAGPGGRVRHPSSCPAAPATALILDSGFAGDESLLVYVGENPAGGYPGLITALIRVGDRVIVSPRRRRRGGPGAGPGDGAQGGGVPRLVVRPWTWCCGRPPSARATWSCSCRRRGRPGPSG